MNLYPTYFVGAFVMCKRYDWLCLWREFAIVFGLCLLVQVALCIRKLNGLWYSCCDCDWVKFIIVALRSAGAASTVYCAMLAAQIVLCCACVFSAAPWYHRLIKITWNRFKTVKSLQRRTPIGRAHIFSPPSHVEGLTIKPTARHCCLLFRQIDKEKWKRCLICVLWW